MANITGKLHFPQIILSNVCCFLMVAPAIRMVTPNGRFKTDYRLCLSMSDYHPGIKESYLGNLFIIAYKRVMESGLECFYDFNWPSLIHGSHLYNISLKKQTLPEALQPPSKTRKS